MGMLGNQPETSSFRIKEVCDVDELVEKSSIKDAAADLQAVAKELKIPLSDVIQIYIGLNISRLCAMKRVDSDKMDENIAGLGEIIRDGIDEIKREIVQSQNTINAR